MVAYNFQPEFGPAILRGTKRSTMRPEGKRRHARVGETVQLFVGLRSDAAFRLLDAPVIEVERVDVTEGGILIGDRLLSDPAELEAFAAGEGFAGIGSLQAWFDRRYGLPVCGLTLIRWDFDTASFRADWPAFWDEVV